MFETEIQKIFEGTADVIGVYIFGSYAGGKQRTGSDVDIALLFESQDRSRVAGLLENYMVELSRLLRKDVHLVAMNFAGEVLLKQILSKGRCLVMNNPRKMSLFRMSAVSRIFDFEYHRRKMQAGLIRKVMEG